MAIGCGVIVANIYYCQPLLGVLARSFSVSQEKIGMVNILTQAGYGLGLLFLVPIGDMLERRKLIVVLHLLAALSLFMAAISPTLNSLLLACFLIGVTSCACQVIIPFAAHLALKQERGKVIGTMLGGLLTGILISRTISGLIADIYGWRSVYLLSSCMMIIMAVLLWLKLPVEKPTFSGSYKQLMESLWRLFSSQPIVRQSAFIGASLFGALSAFWATLAFFLEGSPFHYNLSIIGLFGLIGAGGALAAPILGKFTDSKDPIIPIRWGISLMIAGFIVLWWWGHYVLFVIAGVILLDIGMQSAHIPNQARNYALLPEARTRLNTIYMTCFFLGGTLGSCIGSAAWNWKGWAGVCFSGLCMAAISIGVVFNPVKKIVNRNTQ
ncbi:MAG: MFS transporter [Chitinophagaceae bacterium]